MRRAGCRQTNVASRRFRHGGRRNRRSSRRGERCRRTRSGSNNNGERRRMSDCSGSLPAQTAGGRTPTTGPIRAMQSRGAAGLRHGRRVCDKSDPLMWRPRRRCNAWGGACALCAHRHWLGRRIWLDRGTFAPAGRRSAGQRRSAVTILYILIRAESGPHVNRTGLAATCAQRRMFRTGGLRPFVWSASRDADALSGAAGRLRRFVRLAVCGVDKN